MKELFKKIIKEFHEKGIPQIKNRNIDIALNSKKIVTIIGPRRAGKTYLLYQLAKQIKDITDIVYINFEDERYTIKKEHLQQIMDAYLELYPDKKKPYFFFDEIQEINDWEKFVRRTYDTISKKIFLTGSSAKLLSKEIATTLRGRTITYELYPLSFKEYLEFKEISSKMPITTKEQAKVRHEFNNYLVVGGYPETVFFEDELRERTIKDYSAVMLLRDVIDRYQLRNSLAVSSFYDRCITNYSKELSINKLFNEMKSIGIRITRETLYEFARYFEEAFIVFPLTSYTQNISKKEIKKIYLIDHAIANLSKFRFSENNGRNLENIVFIELRRKELDVYTFKSRGECDFIVKEKGKITKAIQVCYELNNNNKTRELSGLKEAMKRFKLKKGTILTYDQEDIIKTKNETIIIKPIWKWLIQ